MTSVFKDKKFLKALWILAIPIMIQSFITSSLNLVDNVMVGKLGEEAIASVGLANQYMFIFTLCIMGINAGASVFMSQFWGKRDIGNIKKVLGLDMSVGLIAAIIFAVAAFLFPNEIMQKLSKDPEVIRLGGSYLKVVAITCIFTNFTQAFSSILRSTEQTKHPMYASLIGVLSNAFLNWVFIFGNLGSPVLGVVGAGIATSIARLIEMIYIIGVVYIPKNFVASKISELFNFDLKFVLIYFKTSWSVIVNELLWALGMTFYSVAYAKIGTNAVASMQIATTLSNMFMVFLIGIATASAIMVGSKIGEGEENRAREYAKNIGVITPILGVILGIGIFVLAPIILKPFNVTPETYQDTLKILKIMALFFPIKSFNMVMIVGIFRGGGDTTYSMLVQIGTVWFYAIPMAFFGANLGLPIYMVYVLICTEECVKIFFEVTRLKSGKWLRNVIGDI